MKIIKPYTIKPKVILCIVLISLFLIPLITYATTIYNIKDDWSDANNPNGVWSLNRNGNLLLTSRIAGGNTWATSQQAWGAGEIFENVFQSNGTEQFPHDWQLGDIVTHTPNNTLQFHEIKWTSPEDGVFSISGAAWSTRTSERTNIWSLYTNGNFLTQGVLPFVGPNPTFTRANPFLFVNGTNGSSVLQNLSLLKGDMIQLRLGHTAGPYGDYVGLNLQIEGGPPAPLEEDCTNGVDDDGDGLVDCEDPDCTDFPGCLNNLPIVDCGENNTITSEEVCNTAILGTVTDSDLDDSIFYRWLEGETVLQDWLPVGTNGECPLPLCDLPISIATHTLTLESNDGNDTSSCEMILTIDNTSPHVAPSGGGTYQIGESVNLGGFVSDHDGDTLSYEWKEGANVLSPCYGTLNTVVEGIPEALPTCSVSNLSLGSHTITINISDGINDTVIGEINVIIIDTTRPTIAPVVNIGILWPPNHNMVDIVIAANAVDNSGLPVTLSAVVSSNESQEGLGDGDMTPDWAEPAIDNGAGVVSLQLRAERSGSGNSRVYNVYITATDSSNNSSTANVEVIVPHDKRKK